MASPSAEAEQTTPEQNGASSTDYEAMLAQAQSNAREERGDVFAGIHGGGRHETEEEARVMAEAAQYPMELGLKDEAAAVKAQVAGEVAQDAGNDYVAANNQEDARRAQEMAGRSFDHARQQASEEARYYDRDQRRAAEAARLDERDQRLTQ
jgi:hypothetical protein